jgi:ABC-type uncharacterized transport system permease subunit
MIPAAAGFFYFALVFAAGFVLGAVRTLWLAPAVGDAAATLIELPVILAVSWAACLFILRRMKVKTNASDRIVMGASAFALLIGAEIALGLGLMNRSFSEQISTMTAPAGLIGLAGQILFAAFPLLALSLRR